MRGVGEEDLEGMREEMRLEAESNLGMSMIFAMASVGQEWLRRRYQGDSYEACDVEDGYGSDDDGNKRSMDAEEEKRMEARSHGQMVDATTFQAWKEKYEAEAALERAMSMDVRLESEKKKRMTGRMFFESGGFSMDDEEQDLQEEYDVEDADLDELDEEELAYLEEEVSERLHLQG